VSEETENSRRDFLAGGCALTLTALLIPAALIAKVVHGSAYSGLPKRFPELHHPGGNFPSTSEIAAWMWSHEWAVWFVLLISLVLNACLALYVLKVSFERKNL